MGPWSDAEQRLHLVPRRKRDEGREEAEHEQRPPETQAGPPCGVAPLDLGPPPGPLTAVRAFDREGVERRGLVGQRRGSSACRAGHTRILGNISRRMDGEEGRPPVETLAEAAVGVAAAGDLPTALDVLAQAARAALEADTVVVRLADEEGRLEARAFAPAGSTLGAELAGTRASVDELLRSGASEATERAAARTRAAGLLAVPARVEGRVVGLLEAVRVASPFGRAERRLAELAAAQLALAIRGLAPNEARRRRRDRLLGLAGDALAAGTDVERSARQAIRIAVDASEAQAGALWRRGLADAPVLAASHGLPDELVAEAGGLAAAALRDRPAPAIALAEQLPASLRHVATLPLGQSPSGVLQLFFAVGDVPSAHELRALSSFAARTAHALREGERVRAQVGELERTRALLGLIGDASSRLSLAHTLETVVDRVGHLLPVDRLGVYLLDEDRLSAAGGRALPSEHLKVATALLDALRGPLRARASVHVVAGGEEPALEHVRDALRETGESAVIAAPLQMLGEPIGLLAAYPRAGSIGAGDEELLAALAAQLAVAVQNARLHEQSQQLFEERSTALRSARETGRRLVSLYEIANAFTQSLSLERTVDAIGATVVDALEVDAAVVRSPDQRGDVLVSRSVHVADERHAGAMKSLLEHPQPARTLRDAAPELLDARKARRLGGAHSLLLPFLEQGSTAALIPIVGQGELLAELTVVSLDPARPIGADALTTARTLAQQAALAFENARLHQQLTHFAETMRKSLLPQEPPSVRDLDVGYRYESAAQVEVGGDVFDFLELPDGRLALVLGDVTGHGIDAAAEMAMAKFVFRSLARRHPEPSEFLARANDVVVAEITGGAFITMAYLAADPDGRVGVASAGHPRPRLVHADGRIEELHCGGLALGIAPDQTYDEVRVALEPGSSVVVYTDGVVEARSDGELYGLERLDAVLTASAGEGAQALADAVIADCRAFAAGELDDDCAIVVIGRP